MGAGDVLPGSIESTGGDTRRCYYTPLVYVSQEFHSGRQSTVDHGQGMGLHVAMWPDDSGTDTHPAALGSGLEMDFRDEVWSIS